MGVSARRIHVVRHHVKTEEPVRLMNKQAIGRVRVSIQLVGIDVRRRPIYVRRYRVRTAARVSWERRSIRVYVGLVLLDRLVPPM